MGPRTKKQGELRQKDRRTKEAPVTKNCDGCDNLDGRRTHGRKPTWERETGCAYEPWPIRMHGDIEAVDRSEKLSGDGLWKQAVRKWQEKRRRLKNITKPIEKWSEKEREPIQDQERVRADKNFREFKQIESKGE